MHTESLLYTHTHRDSSTLFLTQPGCFPFLFLYQTPIVSELINTLPCARDNVSFQPDLHLRRRSRTGVQHLHQTRSGSLTLTERKQKRKTHKFHTDTGFYTHTKFTCTPTHKHRTCLMLIYFHSIPICSVLFVLKSITIYEFHLSISALYLFTQ